MTGNATAPEFPSSLSWPDRPRPLQLGQALRGEVVVILFWRVGCVHGRHALADLSELQGEFAGRGVTCVAVHVPVLPAEAEEWRVRAELRALPHVLTAAIDGDGASRRAFGATGNPALVLVDADGTICFRGRGEPDLARLRGAVRGLLTAAAERGLVPAVPFVPCAWRDGPPRAAGGLRAPAGLAAGHDGTVWVADTGNHRLLRIDPSGRVGAVVGRGTPGLVDTDPAIAAFHAPMGLLVSGERLFVADRGNHCLRLVTPAHLTVTTVCGTGARSNDRFGGGFGERQGLCSPIALANAAGGVHVAQAGAHQIWQFDPDTQAASAWLGTGTASLRDGDEAAAFAQPSGLWAEEHTLWVADAANGAIRAVDLAHGRVRTVATGLVRPVAVAVAVDRVWIADAWRGAVLAMPAAGGEPVVVAQRADGLVAPSALAVVGDWLWIADAGTDSLWRLPLAAGAGGLQPLELTGVPPAPANAPSGGCTVGREVAVRAFADVTLDLVLHLPPDSAVDASAPIAVHVVDEDGATLAVARHGTAEVVDGALRVAHVALAEPGVGLWRLRVEVGLRSGGSAEPQRRTWQCVVPVRAIEGGPLTAVIRV